ncbi:MAG: TA system VapC family ribonuclease toxin [Mycobacteriales bacterium]
MTRALLDINVLLALLDSDHVDHARAHDWLEGAIATGWASCAITQNGFIRIITRPRYPSPISATHAINLLDTACAQPQHDYWTCEISLLDPAVIDRSRVLGPRQVTDAYLLALAVRHDGRFVTFDRSVPVSTVAGATADHLEVL